MNATNHKVEENHSPKKIPLGGGDNTYSQLKIYEVTSLSDVVMYRECALKGVSLTEAKHLVLTS